MINLMSISEAEAYLYFPNTSNADKKIIVFVSDKLSEFCRQSIGPAIDRRSTTAPSNSVVPLSIDLDTVLDRVHFGDLS
jgi:hypothetical protein